MINGVRVFPLKQVADDRGKVMHMVQVGDAGFIQFGEIYFSMVKAGAVKAWHLHKEMVLNYAVPHGTIKLVLYDDRPGSPTRGQIQEFLVGENDYCLVQIPALVWNGFQAQGDRIAIVANCATIPYAASEIERVDPGSPRIPYAWKGLSR